jgi:hypothetical protein
MNFIEWGNKLYNYYFNEENKYEEILLYVDEQTLSDIGGENGVNDFLSIFNPKEIITSAYPKPDNKYSTREGIKDRFKTIEKLLLYLLEKPKGDITINGIKTVSSDPKVTIPFIIMVLFAYNTEDGIFMNEQDQKMLGSDLNIRKYTLQLLENLSKKVNDNIGVLESQFIEKMDGLKEKYYRLSQEDEKTLEDLFKKYL